MNTATGGPHGPGRPSLLLAPRRRRGRKAFPFALMYGMLGCFPAAAGSQSLLSGDPERGEVVFRSFNCSVCHRLNGAGGQVGPDFAVFAERAFSPSMMAARLWTHAPVMWAAMDRAEVARPELSEQQGADLFVFLFASSSFEEPGNARRGAALFREKRCSGCHGAGSPKLTGARPVSAWSAPSDAAALAQQMWNHYGEMRSALEGARIPRPRLSSQELRDILSYVRTLRPSEARQTVSPNAAQSGEQLFVSRGCAGCHQGNLKLAFRWTRFSLTEFAASMWNHPFSAAQNPQPLGEDEMRRLLGYLISNQFLEERGDPERGRRVFASKRCAVCHDDPAGDAPSRQTMAGKMTSFRIAAALWLHGPSMLARMRQKHISWPSFTGAEMADLTSYLHGAQLKRRERPNQ